MLTRMARHFLHMLLALALVPCLLALDENATSTVTTPSGMQIQFMGKSPQFRLYPNPNATDYIQVKLGRLVELDAQKRPVRGRRLPPLANMRAALTQGMFETPCKPAPCGSFRREAICFLVLLQLLG
jgi:hypothetical protein